MHPSIVESCMNMFLSVSFFYVLCYPVETLHGGIMWPSVLCVLANVLVIMVSPCCGHVGLYYPPARTYALDFLDSHRTQWPCGMARGHILALL